MKLSQQETDIIKKEIKKIRKHWLTRITDAFKAKSVISIVVWVIITILLGALVSILANIIFS